MNNKCRFREVQRWPRFIAWPLIIVAWSGVGFFAMSQGDSYLNIFALMLAIIAIPFSFFLLEWMGPTVEVSQERLTFSIWPFYRKDIAL